MNMEDMTIGDFSGKRKMSADIYRKEVESICYEATLRSKRASENPKPDEVDIIDSNGFVVGKAPTQLIEKLFDYADLVKEAWDEAKAAENTTK